MKKSKILFILLAALCTWGFKEETKGYKVGDTVRDFNLRSTSGEYISLAGLKEVKGCIVVFTCNHCPFSVAYEDRIIALHNKYASRGYPVVAINPNDAATVPDDSYELMIVRAREKAFPFNYLADISQETAKEFGASRTPHVFVLQKEKQGFVVRYIGAIDDNTDDAGAVTKKYVEDAVEALINGTPVQVPFTKAIGCSIKWKKD